MTTITPDFARDRATSNWRHGYHLLPSVINRFGLRVGVEIGVANGGHADAILTQCPGVTKLYGVDPYQNRAEYQDLMNLPQEHLDAMHDEMREFMKKHGERFEFFRSTSKAAAGFTTALCEITNQSPQFLDFVYIDAEHTYEACKADIAAWYPLLRPGGILSGHDYGGFPGVTRAVNEFCAAMELELHVETEYFWWTVKEQA